MITTCATGDLLRADAQVLVNPVNCVGVMGNGLAVQFKLAFYGYFRSYEAACATGTLRPGVLHLYEVPDRLVVSFPTKRHWRNESRLEDIEAGLAQLVSTMRERGLKSVAIPALGCGLGGLAWTTVRPLVVKAFEEGLPEAHVMLFEPRGW